MIQAVYITWDRDNYYGLDPYTEFPLNPGQKIAWCHIEGIDTGMRLTMKITDVTKLTDAQYKYLELPGITSSVELYI